VRILVLASAFNGLCQRVVRELTILGHVLDQHYCMNEMRLRTQLERFKPDIILCPFLTQKIPDDIWRNYRCLVVHPGIEGDRGPSSLDWAISDSVDYWGVTLLQADAEMDAGNIWGSVEFLFRHASKTSLYKREVTTSAVQLILRAVSDAQILDFNPRPLDYSNPSVRGILRDGMRQYNRKIDWQQDSTDIIIRKILASDTVPGVLDDFLGTPVYLFGPLKETTLMGSPGDWIASAYGAICRATRDGAIWIRQMKCTSDPKIPAIKMPAAQLVKTLNSHIYDQLSRIHSETPNDIHIEYRGTSAYIHFNFYNGAANTEQCVRLTNAIKETKKLPVKIIVLMGGEDFFCNGIQLNCIEAASDPSQESWENINAIDDLVKEIIETPDQLTISALRNNAGAGGAILPLACDRVVIRDGVVLNPHYDKMGLFGSEYWTYLLPKRIGSDMALKLTKECQPMIAKEALNIGFADTLIEEDWEHFHQQLFNLVERISNSESHEQTLALKLRQRMADEKEKPLATYRAQELNHMHTAFFDLSSRYHKERRTFVYKGKVPTCWEYGNNQLEKISAE
jgi:putative two-component system protein, hydrogenase maturation factor HypX/HoxX